MSEQNDIFNMLMQLENNSSETTKDKILRAPFVYPGGKSRSILQILPHLPYTRCYVEPFGGSAAVMLARSSSPIEVFNDRYAGVTSFYRCIRDYNKMNQMCEWLENTVHSREEFVWCRDTWANVEDDVERACRWYYMIQTSFGGLGRNFGRATKAKTCTSNKRYKNLKHFSEIQNRFRDVQVENQNWVDCVHDYDALDTVFYMDPPYLSAYTGTYQHEMSYDEHKLLLDTVFSLDGFIAISGYSNELYERYKWDARYEWEVFISAKSLAYSGNNGKTHLEGVETRGKQTEVLWIKNFK